MRKLILGIIAVICLDVAFIVYPEIRQPGRIAYQAVNYQARSVAALADQSASDEVAGVSNDPSSDGSNQMSTADRKAPASRFRRNVGDSDEISARMANDRRSLNQRALFKPTVIVVGRSNSTEGSFDRQPDPVDRLKKGRADERSFVSMVMPVVKKPYELIKYIGSKLR